MLCLINILKFKNMTSSNLYSYGDRNIFDLKTLIDAIRFFVVNVILAFIFLFLTIEEVDWTIFSLREKVNDRVIDHTSWNLSNLF